MEMRASAMYVNYNLPNLDTVIRRNLFGYIQGLFVSQNSVIRKIQHYWLKKKPTGTIGPKFYISKCSHHKLLILKNDVLLVTENYMYIFVCVYRYIFI